MPEKIDWSTTTYAGNRRRQHEEFFALTFREKLMVIEDLEAFAERLSLKLASGEKPAIDRQVSDGSTKDVARKTIS